MSSSLEINGTELQSIRSAAECTGYSRDYITRLAREQKVIASQIGRQWFVDITSLKRYATDVANEQSLRHQQLSEERRIERLAVEKKNVNTKKSTTKRIDRITLKAQTLAVGVLFLGLGLGVLLNKIPTLSSGFSTQVASAPQIQSLQGHSVEIDSAKNVTTSGVDFSHESVGLSTMEGASEGILLLPSEPGENVNPDELFSDDVKVQTDERGQKFVVRVDNNGRVVEKIPFVVVPVTSNETP